MKILFVRPNVSNRFMIVPPLGLGYVAEAARRAGHTVDILDSWLNNDSATDAAPWVAFYESDIVAVQVYQDTVKWTKDLFALLNGKVETMVGGHYTTSRPDSIKADIIVKGWGEPYFTGKPFDINDIAAPMWDLIDLPSYWKHMQPITAPTRGKRPANIQRTRGCNHRCTFCAGHVVNGYKVLIRDDENVLEEIDWLVKVYGVDEIWFQDDNTIYDYHRALALFDKLASYKLHIRLPNGIRIENVSEEMVRMMKRAGVYFTGIGIESGNERVLHRVRKHLDLNLARHAIELLDTAGIMTSGFFIIGLPTETEDEIEDTIRYALSTRIKRAQFGIFQPCAGSSDGNETPSLPPARLKELQRSAMMRFYGRPSIVWSMAKDIRLSQIVGLSKHPWLR